MEAQNSLNSAQSQSPGTSKGQTSGSGGALSQLGKNLDKLGHNIVKNVEKIDKLGKKTVKAINHQTGVGSFISSLTAQQRGDFNDMDEDSGTVPATAGSPKNQQQHNPVSALSILKDAILRIQAHVPKRLKEVREECQRALDYVAAREGDPGASKPKADEFFAIWKLGIPEAVKDQSLIRMAQSMLGGLQKLLEVGLIVGDGPDYLTIAENKRREAAGEQAVPVPADRILMDNVMDKVCDVVRIPEETLLTQLVSVVAAAILQQNSVVRGATLMQGIRACFQSYREVKSVQGMRQTHGTLTQIVVTQCQRMEQEALLAAKAAARREGGCDAAAKACLQQWLPGYVDVLVDKTVQQEGGNSSSNFVVVEESGTTQTVVEDGGEKPAGKFGWCIVCREPAPHYCLETKDPVCSRECKQINLDRQANVDLHFPPPSLAVSLGAAVTGTGGPGSPKRLSPLFLEKLPLYKDTFMVFASLCKLSLKEIPQLDQKFIKSKRLTLELIFSMLQNSGPVFRSSEKFVAALKSYLCLAIVRNCLSSVPKIFGLSLSIFLVLVQHFKTHLKWEIPVFIETIFIRILDSGSCTFAHKQRVLSVFYKLCTDPSVAVELFVNYDCDLYSKNLFERMLDVLGKIAQGKFSQPEYGVTIMPVQDQELRVLALESLVGLMNSVVTWAAHHLGDGGTDEDATPSGAGDSDNIPGLPPAGSLPTIDVVDLRNKKAELQGAIEKFNAKPKKGIEAFYKGNFLAENDPDALVDFFRTTTGLDKTAIGDYLGEPAEFNQKVLHTMVNTNSFKDLDLDVALRMFLADFRLPGEAQKIDRMVEKFADKYCTDNPENPEFGTNADCAYVLAFSLVMLQTDLHNDSIKNKMTVEAFQSNNRGINNGGSLSKEYLARLYNNIQRSPITLNEDEDARARVDSQNALNATAKMELFQKESNVMITRATKAFEAIKERHKRMAQAANASAVKTAVDAGLEVKEGALDTSVDEKESLVSTTVPKVSDISDTISVISAITTTTTGAAPAPPSPTSAAAGTITVGGSSSSTSSASSNYVCADTLPKSAVGRPLFEVMCWPMLATLSVLLETTHWTRPAVNYEGQADQEQEQAQPPENRMIELSVHAMRLCIRFAARLNMETHRDAFVCSLAKFTYLATIKEMTQKNVECVKVLLEIGLHDGNHLASSWTHVLQTISYLERLQLIRTLKPDSHFFDESEGKVNSGETSPDRQSQGSVAQRDSSVFGSALGGSTPASGEGTRGSGSIRQSQVKRKVGTGHSGVIRMSEEELHTEYLNSETIISQINISDIDKLFATSTNLSATAIVDFVTALCQVSADELSLRSQVSAEPRIFSLQKLVEVADANMSASTSVPRGKQVWTKVWKVISGHFSDVVSCRNRNVVMYALDSLRQLAMKFLSRPELAEFNSFQAEFLRPMEMVVSSPNANLEAKYFVISVVQNLMKANHSSIKTGWKNLFQILEQTTKPANMGIPMTGGSSKDGGQQQMNVSGLTKEQLQARKTLILNSFAVIQGAIENHQQHFVGNFQEGMTALVGFAQCPMLSTAQALEVIQLIFNAAEYLSKVAKEEAEEVADRETVQGGAGDSSSATETISGVDSPVKTLSKASAEGQAAQWFPLLRAMCTLSGDSRKEVRTRALNGLFELLKTHGGACFDQDTWRVVFRGVLFPLFDDIQLEVVDRKQQDTICLSAFSNCVSLVDAHFAQLSFLLGDVIQVLASTVTHTVESVARLGVEALKQLIEKSGDKFSPENWELVAGSVEQLFQATTPVAIQDELYTALVRQHQIRTGGAKKAAQPKGRAQAG